MARPKRYLDWKQSIYIATWGAVAPATATAAANAYLSGYHPAFTAMLGGLSVASGVLATSPFWYRSQYKPRRQRFENLTDFTPFDIRQIGQDDNAPVYEARWKERPRPEFRFTSTERLPLHSPLPLSIFRRLVEVGWHRQLNAEYGKPGSIIETGTGRYTRLHPNQAWSRNYLCRLRRGQRRFTEDNYEDTITILYATGFYDTRPNRLTHPGRLIEPLIGVEKTVQGAMEIWKAWYNTPSPLPRRRYIGMAARIAPIVRLFKPQQATTSH